MEGVLLIKIKMTACSFMKKTSFTHNILCILPSFSQNTSRLLLLKRLWSCLSTLSFRNYQRFIFNLLHIEYGIWQCLEYGFCQINKLELFVSCNTCSFYAANSKKKSFTRISFFYSACISLHHGDMLFYFIFISISKHRNIVTLSKIISTMKKC